MQKNKYPYQLQTKESRQKAKKTILDSYRNGKRKPTILLKEKNPSWKGGQINKVCQTCNKEFLVYPYRKEARFCSIICASKNRKPKILTGKYFVCKECNRKFYRHKSNIDKGIVKYCSNKCWGKELKEFFKDKTRHPNWQGGITKELAVLRASDKYIIWREKVYQRDNYTCKKCGDNKGGNLEAHHIFPFAYFSKLRFDVKNGLTLCSKCHKETDTYFKHFGKIFPEELRFKFQFLYSQ